MSLIATQPSRTLQMGEFTQSWRTGIVSTFTIKKIALDRTYDMSQVVWSVYTDRLVTNGKMGI